MPHHFRKTPSSRRAAKPTEGPWTIYVCPECDRVQGFGGRCRNALAHKRDKRVMLESREVGPVNQPSGAVELRVLYDNCVGLANDDDPDVEAAVRLALSLPPSRYAKGQ